MKIAPSLYHLDRIDNVVKTATPPPNEWPVITKRYPGYVLKASLRIRLLSSIILLELSAMPLWAWPSKKGMAEATPFRIPSFVQSYISQVL